MRYGLLSALYVATKLGTIAALVIISFLFHYFLIVAFLPLKDSEDGIEYQERQQFFSSTGEGLYNMFVALTTANHPDVLLPSYDRQWYMMLLLFSFMAITNLFLLNVFLGVVTSEYRNMVQQFYLGKNEVCEGMLGSAARILRERNPKWRLRGERDCGVSLEDFLDVIRLSHGNVDVEKQKLWFQIMDVDGALACLLACLACVMRCRCFQAIIRSVWKNSKRCRT